MKVGTKSVLFGAHCFFLHPWFVAWGWWKLYGFPWNPTLWVAFFVHDLGYLGKPNMDGPEGESHPEFGAKIMATFDDYPYGPRRWEHFCLYHSRYYAKKQGAPPSRLCFADKLAFTLTPRWLYLPMVTATGEINEYLKCAETADSGHWKPTGFDKQRWHAQLCDYMTKWVEEHKRGAIDTWTDANRNARAGDLRSLDRPPVSDADCKLIATAIADGVDQAVANGMKKDAVPEWRERAKDNVRAEELFRKMCLQFQPRTITPQQERELEAVFDMAEARAIRDTTSSFGLSANQVRAVRDRVLNVPMIRTVAPELERELGEIEARIATALATIDASEKDDEMLLIELPGVRGGTSDYYSSDVTVGDVRKLPKLLAIIRGKAQPVNTALEDAARAALDGLARIATVLREDDRAPSPSLESIAKCLDMEADKLRAALKDKP